MNLQVHIDTNAPLQLSPITVNEDYRKKWNVISKDFMLLSKNDKPIRETLYRLGGLGSIDSLKDDYFMLLKYVEDFYSDDITKDKTRKPHLDGRWCILDKDGNEKAVFTSSLKSPSLIKNSVIYSLEYNYYNIETGEIYCNSYTRMTTEEYLFLHNEYDNDKSKRGVMKINKKDGSFELFKG